MQHANLSARSPIHLTRETVELRSLSCDKLLCIGPVLETAQWQLSGNESGLSRLPTPLPTVRRLRRCRRLKVT
eukprot:2171140-Alexandrium_andersonii.AAC.1